MTYEELIINYEGIVKIKEANFLKNDFLKSFSGLYKNGKIVINSMIKTNTQKKCVLVEELGHHFTSSGNILNTKDISNIKQEKIARNWGYEKLVEISDLINAFKYGAKNKNEIAEFLDVTELFLEEAIQHYRQKYGVMFKTNEYIIYFEPNFGILKKL